jgi:hypothetical protein
MWARPLFAVRRLTVDLGPRLGSWRLSIVLMVVAALYYGFLAVWAGSSPGHVVRSIAALLPFWLVYALLLVNTAVCLWRRVPALRRDVSRSPTPSEQPADWMLDAAQGMNREQAVRTLRGLGYRSLWVDTDRVGAARRRWSGLGTFLFHGAFFVLAVGFLATFLASQEATVWVATGEEFTGHPGQFLSQSPPRALATGVPEMSFTVQRIVPEFWRDQLLFTTLEAELELAGGVRRTTRINRPLWLGPATFLRMSGFGYAPRYELRDREGRVLDGAFIKMNVFPPGQQDYFVLPDYPHRFYVEVLPDLAQEDGQAVSRSLNLVEPGVVVRVQRGRLDLGGSLLRADEGFEFEGLTLLFPEIRYWGEFSIVHDPGAPVLLASYLLGLAGLLLKVRGGRGDAEWRPGTDGTGGSILGWGPGRPRRARTATAGH